MEQKRTAPRAQKTQPLTYREWKRRKQARLARNWGLFLTGCALVVFLLTKGILCSLPHLHSADGPQTFAASAYDSTGYFFDADDARLVLVNANLPLTRNLSHAGCRRRGGHPAGNGGRAKSTAKMAEAKTGRRHHPDAGHRLSGCRHPHRDL